MDKKFSKEYRRKTWIIAIYDSDDQGSWMGKIEATKKEVKEILAAIVQSFRDRNLDFYEGGTETALYFYGESYLKLYESVKHILEIHPLCKLSHVKQIA